MSGREIEPLAAWRGDPGALRMEVGASRHASGVESHTVRLTNVSGKAVEVTRALPFAVELADDNLYLTYFQSGWSREFSPVRVAARTMTLEGVEGRCSAGIHPMFFISDEAGRYRLAITVAWSGNWRLSLRRAPGALRVEAGMYEEAMVSPLQPGETFVSPRVLCVRPEHGAIDEITAAFTAFHREENGVRGECALSLPVEWNHWWAYEDYGVNEEVFLQNARAAAELGFEACVLDAGWYGMTDDCWDMVRADWSDVNPRRFPRGIRVLSDAVHALGMRFGLWCEIEALGKLSRLAGQRPDFMAARSGEPLYCVCFGNPDVRRWAFDTLSALIEAYSLDWVKLDFNHDLWGGCDAADHGHALGDGLRAHYLGYYAMLDELRARYPGVILENCSSGGLRIDLEMMSHLHATFLSDNDETRNNLRFYSAVFPFLPPEACLHWSWSESRCDELGRGPFPSFHAWDDKYATYEKDFHMRAGMLGWYGFSHKLCEFDEPTRALFARHIAFYRNTVRPYVQRGVVSMPEHGAFEQARDRYLFRYNVDGGCLIFLFCLEEQAVMLKVDGLEPKAFYRVENFDEGLSFVAAGSDLRTGLRMGAMRRDESRVVRVTPVRQRALPALWEGDCGPPPNLPLGFGTRGTRA